MKKLFFVLLAVLLFSCGRYVKKATVDQLQSDNFSTDGRKVTVFTTADSTSLRLSVTATLTFAEMKGMSESRIYVFVNPGRTFQSILGIGGAITDASAETFAKLPEPSQQALLVAYYDTTNGIGYTLGRTNINSCDFSSESYTYVMGNDKELSSFNIDHDRKFRIPMIKKVLSMTNGKLTLFASPWSPPAFMKDNNDMLHGGKLIPEYYQPWATYYTKFVKSYEKEGVPIWGISIQNEPMAVQKWESCIYYSEDERDFLKNYLGPTMEREGLGDKKIIVWDHNRDLMVERANTIFNDREAAKYAWGMGFHWYEDWSGGSPMYENVGIVHESYPDKNLIFTEGCPENFNSGRYNFWGLGEKYGRSMINDFNFGAVGWTDWNILLDETGGPNHVGNFCFAPVHADTKSGQLIFTNSYYYIGHFSKFIRPGSKRISCAASRSQLLTTAFINPDGKVAVVVMNQSNKEVTYELCIGNKAVNVTSPAHSIQTLVM